jgi:hypothetical protein
MEIEENIEGNTEERTNIEKEPKGVKKLNPIEWQISKRLPPRFRTAKNDVYITRFVFVFVGLSVNSFSSLSIGRPKLWLNSKNAKSYWIKNTMR